MAVLGVEERTEGGGATGVEEEGVEEGAVEAVGGRGRAEEGRGVAEEEDAGAAPEGVLSSAEAAAREERAAIAVLKLEKAGRLRGKMRHMASGVWCRE